MILLLTCTRFNEKDLNFPGLGWIRILKFKQNLRPLIEKYLLSPFDFRGNSICIIDVNSGTVLMKYKHKVTYYTISRCCQTNSNRLQIFLFAVTMLTCVSRSPSSTVKVLSHCSAVFQVAAASTLFSCSSSCLMRYHFTALAEMSFFEYLSRLFSVQFFVQLPPARDAWFCIRDLTSFLIISVAPVISN